MTSAAVTAALALLPDLAAGAVAGLAVALPVGPVAVLLVGLAARGPLRVAVAGALGVASVDAGYAAVAVLGGLGVSRVLERLAPVLTPLAAVVLVVVGLLTVRSAVRRARGEVRAADRPPAGPWPTYLGLVAMTAANPATLVTFAAVELARAGQPGVAAPGLDAALVFTLGAGLASAAWQLTLVGGGTLLGRLLTGPRGRLVVGCASGALMVALAAAVLLRG